MLERSHLDAIRPGLEPASSVLRSRRAIVTSLGALLLLSGVAVWTYDAVRESLDELLESQLRATVDATAASLALWVDNEKAHVSSWAGAAVTRETAQALQERQRLGQALLGSEPLTRLRTLLEGAGRSGDLRGFVLVDKAGLVLAALEDVFVGRRLSTKRLADLAPVLEGRSVVARPYDDLTLLPDWRPPAPSMYAAAPVLDERGAVLAVLAFRVDPALDFSRVFESGRVGLTGETYAFDADGVMLSASRFDAELRDIGLLPRDSVSSSILRIHVRDPGGDLAEGHVPETPPKARPLTKSAASAVAEEDGVSISGYRNYRGVEVIGAWRWLDAHDIGIATEMNLSEAYRVLRPLGLAFGGLLLLLLAALIALGIGSTALRRMARRVTAVEQLGQYRLVEKVGEGGMAVVYRAEHAMLRRPTAVKLMKPDAVSEEGLARFELEVQLTSELSHPNTIEIYDYGRTPDGTFYYAMEYLDGVSLADLIMRAGALPPARVISILRQVCGSLADAHEHGVVHRDIKPPNIMLCPRGSQGEVAKLLDFGLVKDIDAGADSALTKANVVAGTPQYIAPERITAPEAVDGRSDLYSVGAVAFNLLSADDVFHGATSLEICHHVLKTSPPRVAEVAAQPIPEALDALIDECLAKDPAERPPSALQTLDRLDALAASHPWSRREASAWWAENGAALRGR